MFALKATSRWALALAAGAALASTAAMAAVTGTIVGIAPSAFVRVPVRMTPFQVNVAGDVTAQIYNASNAVMLCLDKQVGLNWMSATCSRNLIYSAQPGVYRFSVIGSPLNRTPGYRINYNYPS